MNTVRQKINRQSRCCSSLRLRCGFTLAEAMMATVVLGVAAVGILVPFTSGAKARAEGIHRTLGAKLASELIEQILDTSTFDSYSEAEGQVKDVREQVLTDPIYSRFSRDVSCSYVYMPQESGTVQAEFILVAVTVNYAGKEVAVINRLISR